MKDMSSSHSRQQHIYPSQHLELFTSPSYPLTSSLPKRRGRKDTRLSKLAQSGMIRATMISPRPSFAVSVNGYTGGVGKEAYRRTGMEEG